MREKTIMKVFRVYQLEDDGGCTELKVDLDSVEELFKSEGVYLLVRFDLRRIFIWKGPRAPVRKKFVSSQEANILQKEAAATRGVRLKIISVDAGDEPAEFLMAFKIQSYEIAEGEKLEDMYYIRNAERDKIEEAKMAEELKKKKEKGKDEYISPIFKEQKHMEQRLKAKKKAFTSIKKEKDNNQLISLKNLNESEILEEILRNKNNEGLRRLNIIIGTSLYGKNVEEESWEKISHVSNGNFSIDSSLIRIYCKNDLVIGLEIFKNLNEELE